jgi:Tetratricopeptide repeat
MSNEIKQDGTGNIAIQDSKVKITIQISDNASYKQNKRELETTKRYFAKLNLSDEDYLSTSQTINELESSIELYEKTLRDTAKVLEQAKDDKDLDSVRQFIEEGNIEEARVWFADNKEILFEDEKRLDAKRQATSNKFLIWASLSQTDYDNPNWFADSCSYFERSIKAFENKNNLWSFAYFLTNNKIYDKAESLYQKLLAKFADKCSDIDFADICNNLALLFDLQNKTDQAIEEYKNSLNHYRKLAESNCLLYKPYVAMVLNNLANLHQKKQYKYNEVLKEYEEVIEIYWQFENKGSRTYKPDIAMTMTNVAILHCKYNKFDLASSCFEEALKLNKELANNNFQLYFLDYARSLANSSYFYLHNCPNRDKSIDYGIKAMKILLPYVEKVPDTAECYVNALRVLESWNLTNKQIQQLITDSENQKS